MSAPLGSSLRIVIAGAGMGGLATALALAKEGFQHIHVYETASNLGFVGAGIQVAPNLSRVLERLDVWDLMKDDAVEMKEASIRVSATDEELANVKLTHVAERYGKPHCVAHRSALANALYEGCKAAAPHVTIHFRHTVVGVDFDNTRVQVKERDEEGEGHWVDADIILGADGVKSIIRTSMLAKHGEAGDVKDTGQAAYRIMLRRDQLAHDPELLAFVESNTTFRWIGAKRHIIAYPISANTIFNISTAQPDVNFAAEPTATWTTRADKNAMLAVYADFCPLVTRMLELVPEGEVCEWKLRVHHPLRTWVEGNVALLGDACHPTLPHLNQGAAQAIEDGAVLGVVLGKLTDKQDINAALLVYERLRKSRTEHLVDQAAESGRARCTSPTPTRRPRATRPFGGSSTAARIRIRRSIARCRISFMGMIVWGMRRGGLMGILGR
ncbi:FAD/NAD(P)-binding domain-containing protein [Mycena sanguinolenta]|uniref:FAD/NAD(P)-binding domain-containing protein n=1 Tax=Mycena sanguinolenta TaxID=230812 RepID=A0A8H7D376_9AGAR|nr:FAD/NAD(P)-binding domain-containing protein [Mycena sanguinolenta]